MGILEKIIQMKSQGISEEDIIKNMKQEGVSPKEISDALNQASIKSAVSADNNMEEQNNYIPTPEQAQTNENYPQDINLQSIEQTQSNQNYSTTPLNQESYSPQENYPQVSEGAEYEGGYSGTDSSTMIEIAEQVFSEKIEKLQKQIGEYSEFKELAQTKIDNLSKRLKRIEDIIDNLQMTVLGEVGSYGKNIEGIKNEMSMMQDSFRKMIPNLSNLAEKKHSITNKKTNSKKTHSSKK